MGNHHSHDSKATDGKNLKFAFFLNLSFTILELVGGLYVNSIAIISDAIHDLGDSLSLGSAWYLHHKSKQSADHKYSFGYSRFSLLGALINSLVLLAGSIFVIYEAVARLMEPEHSNASGMILFAIIGLGVNGYAAWKMSGSKSLNEKVVSWHLLEDVLGWAAVLITAIILQFTDNHYLDPTLSLLITLYILWGVIKRLKQTFLIFLQGIPPEIDLYEIKNKILQVEHIKSLHHTHIWSLEGEHHVFSTHVKLENIKDFDEIVKSKQRIKNILKDYHFAHLTIETELDRESCQLE